MIDLKCGKINHQGAKGRRGLWDALVRPRGRSQSFQPNPSKSYQITVNKGIVRKNLLRAASTSLPRARAAVLHHSLFSSKTEAVPRHPMRTNFDPSFFLHPTPSHAHPLPQRRRRCFSGLCALVAKPAENQRNQTEIRPFQTENLCAGNDSPLHCERHISISRL